MLLILEDLHWVDPTTLELLSLLVDQGPTACILTLCTCRPDFHPPWAGRSHYTQVMLQRLPRLQVTSMLEQLAHGKTLPAEVVEQIVSRTDGVPLFVEEVTKLVLESGLLQEQEDHYTLTEPLPPLAIPATLHDALLARLDNLGAVKSLAQLGATLGRAFSYALLQAVAPWDEECVYRGLQQLVAAELLYPRGVPPQAMYVFKHALIHEAAYQSLLKRPRRQYHQQIAQVLEAQFPELCATQPELLAYHYTEAGLVRQAIAYWQRAGQRATQHSANAEAISHLTKGLTLLGSLPDTPERAQHELLLQTTLGSALIATQGHASPDVERAYARAYALCQQSGATPQLFMALWGLRLFYMVRGKLHIAREMGEQLLCLAQGVQDPVLLLGAHQALGTTLVESGDLLSAHTHLQQGITLSNRRPQRVCPSLYIWDPGVVCHAYMALTLWCLGYPEQAVQHSHEALKLAHEQAHPVSLASALFWTALLAQCCRDTLVAYERAETLITLATEQGFAQRVASGMVLRGWALSIQGAGPEALAQMHQGIATYQATGAAWLPLHHLALLAEAYGHVGQAEEGLRVLTEPLATEDKRGERYYEAERYRLEGELFLRHIVPDTQQAESCFSQALAMAHRHQAKSWELRAATSLARLWQQQGKQAEACALLVPVYSRCTEGFDTADLQDAKALLEELGG